MRVLLDTHTYLFAINYTERLSGRVRDLLADPGVERWVSAVTINEIAIKVRIGKLPLPSDRAFYLHHLAELRAKVLPLDLRHAFAVFDLPLHHRDPFDRLLIAQAKEDGLTIATRDPMFSRYDVQRVW